MSEARCQRSEVGDQRSGDRKSMVFNQKRSWVLDHRTEHCSHFLTFVGQTVMIFIRDIIAVLGKIEPRIRFTILAISIGQLVDKMSRISPFRPRLTQVCTDRTGRSPDLSMNTFLPLANSCSADRSPWQAHKPFCILASPSQSLSVPLPYFIHPPPLLISDIRL